MEVTWMTIAVTVAAGGLLILIALAIAGWLRELKRRGLDKQTPAWHDLMAALEPWVFKAILAGEKVGVLGLTELEQKLDGMDKKAVADAVYALLPDYIQVGERMIPTSLLKQLVPREVFAERVKELYDSADAFIAKNIQYLTSQVDAFKIYDTEFEPEDPDTKPLPPEGMGQAVK